MSDPIEGSSKVEGVELPTTIQGDGRYLIELIKKWLEELKEQTNIATGNDTEEEVIVENEIATPRNFKIDFTGGRYKSSWNRVVVSNNQEFDSYEIRTNNNPGTFDGILERTTNTFSTVLPGGRVGRLYLFTRLKDGRYSLPNYANYNKTVPIPPSYINITSVEGGQLINFTQIPPDCIGAVIRINGLRYESETNQFKWESTEQIYQLDISFFDIFGEGRPLSVFTILDTVKNFIVERVGDNLNFKWDSLPAANVRYQVRRADDTPTASWASSDQVFEISGNSSTIAFPNTGKYIFYIKAIDQFNNESAYATYFKVNTEPIIIPNIIETYDQSKLLWPGPKISLNYDEDQDILYMQDNVAYGEYIQAINLPDSERLDVSEPYLARNWVDFNAIAISEGSMGVIWADADFSWDSSEANSNWIGASIDSQHIVTHKIATENSDPVPDLFDFWSFDNSLISKNGISPTLESYIKFTNGRYHGGIKINQFSNVSWPVNLPSEFSLSFYIQKNNQEDNKNGTIIYLESDDGQHWYKVSYNATRGRFIFSNSNGDFIENSSEFVFRNKDVIFIGIGSDGVGNMCLYLHSIITGYTYFRESEAIPISNITKMKVGVSQ